MVSLALKPLLMPLLIAQAASTRLRAPLLPEADGARQGSIGAGEALRLLIVGDSSAAGVGVATQEQAFAGYLTRMLAARLPRRIDWVLHARTGVTTGQALALVQDARPAPAEIAVVVLGVNDIIDQVPVTRALRQRAALADWLRAECCVAHVVFTPLPPIDRFPLLPQPLRWVAGSDAQRHDRALAVWAAQRTDVSHVPIEVEIGLRTMAADGFHPGEPVYRTCGETIAAYIADHLIPTEMHP